MKEVKIFVACAKKLSREREALKVAANDLTAHYQNKKRRDVSIVVNTYENLDERQEDYNEFIEHTADMVFFILDGRIGEKTEEEFLRAAKMLEMEDHPEIVVFLKTFEEQTPEILHIEDLLREHFGRYYKTYNNEAHLKSQVREKIMQFVDKTTAETKTTHSTLLKSLVASLAVAVIVCGISLFSMYKKLNRPTIMFAGGGSVANFMDSVYKIDVSDLNDGYYLHMPTEDAWTLLAEEVITKQTVERYYPVCLSAEELKPSSLTKNISEDEFMKKARVVTVKLGIDPLMVRIKNDAVLLKHVSADNLKNKRITLSELTDVIDNSDSSLVKTYTTSNTSGTRKTYERKLSNSTRMSSVKRYFSMNSSQEKVDLKSPYVFLGSKYYQLDILNDRVGEDCYDLTVVDDNGKEVYKDVYLLFLIKKEIIKEKDCWYVPKMVLDFLRTLNEKNPDLKLNIDEKFNKDGYKKSEYVEDLVIPFDKL